MVRSVAGNLPEQVKNNQSVNTAAGNGGQKMSQYSWFTVYHMTQIDGNHFVMGKVPNLYVARTDKVRSIGWDENIRMMDHQDFFWRAAGNLVSVIALGTAVFHYHNPFQWHYQKYRQDVEEDKNYIAKKRKMGL